MKKTIALLMALVMVLCLLPSMTLAALDTGHRIDVLGYNTGSSEKTTFVCQYSEPHSDTAYNNHTIAISDIKAAAERATVNSGYEITGWTKEASANPKVWGFNIKEPTACNKGTTIYLVATPGATPTPSATPTPPPSAIPGQPGADTLKSLLGKIKVTCVTDTAHGTEEFDLIDDSYTVGDVEGDAISGYTCDVSISPAKYVAAYNAEVPGHTTDDTAKTVTLKYNSGAWALNNPNELPVEFNVKCETPHPTTPDKPDDHDTLKDLLGKIKVTCVTNGTTHGPKEFNLLAGSYTVGNVEGSANSGYTCDITVRPELYVAEYVKDFGSHTLSPTGQTGTITLIYDAEEQAWKPMPNQNPIVFYVKDETFTVTYLDGFSGTYATYTNLKSGVLTPVPANPYRSGYIFLGWQPSVAPTVTGDARYVAQWGYIGPQYPNPTPVQPVQPGILPPQTGDMPLWYAIARFLGLVK